MFLSNEVKVINFSSNNMSYPFNLGKQIIPYMDVTFVLSGNMEYIINGERILLSSGDAIVIPPNSQRGRVASQKPTNYCSFNVLIPEGFLPIISGRIPKCINSSIVYMIELFTAEWKSKEQYYLNRCSSVFTYLYFHLANSYSSQNNLHIKKIKSYIEGHLFEKITLDHIAKEVYLAPQYCCHLFHREMGVTIVDYILSQRLEHAKQLLLSENTPLNLLAEKLGFSNYNYFSRVFKKKTGMSPSQYRKIF